MVGKSLSIVRFPAYYWKLRFCFLVGNENMANAKQVDYNGTIGQGGLFCFRGDAADLSLSLAVYFN